MIDAKDLLVGSIIRLNEAIREVLCIEGEHIRTATLDKKYAYNYTHISQFAPVVITPELLNRLGLWFSEGAGPEDSSWTYALHEYDEDGEAYTNSVYIISLGDVETGTVTEMGTEYEKDWVISFNDSDNYLTRLSGLHHLQQLMWSLARVWLTLTPATIS